MTTQEHLQRIKARCQELLALAEKRTPGEWSEIAPNEEGTIGRRLFAGTHYSGFLGNSDSPELEACDNATYIASCAGAAEAGWRATIAAVDECLSDDPLYQSMYELVNEKQIRGIIAAWPEELL